MSPGSAKLPWPPEVTHTSRPLCPATWHVLPAHCPVRPLPTPTSSSLLCPMSSCLGWLRPPSLGAAWGPWQPWAAFTLRLLSTCRGGGLHQPGGPGDAEPHREAAQAPLRHWLAGVGAQHHPGLHQAGGPSLGGGCRVWGLQVSMARLLSTWLSRRAWGACVEGAPIFDVALCQPPSFPRTASMSEGVFLVSSRGLGGDAAGSPLLALHGVEVGFLLLGEGTMDPAEMECSRFPGEPVTSQVTRARPSLPLASRRGLWYGRWWHSVGEQADGGRELGAGAPGESISPSS